MNVIPFVLIFLAVLTISGCLAVSPEAIIASSPVVQNFLADYPNAEIKATFYSEAEAAQILDQIKADCEKDTVTAKDFYKVTIKDEDSGLSLTAWVDWNRQIVECVIKKTKSGEKVESDDATKEYKKESCESKYKLACHDGHVYWFDSCGNEQEKYKYCAHGCEVGDCVEADDCEPHDEHACHNGHVYWYDSCGNKEEKKEYCEHGCANGVCVESGEEADSELICCESYGLGAMMVKCCESYEWTTTEECNVPEGFVGGGKNIVDDSYCEEECYESDDGYDIYNAGVAEAGDQRLEDHCNDDGTLTEKYCEGNEIKWKSVPCPGGYSCIDARCVMLYECTDSDDEVEDGLNYYKKGTTDYREKGVLLRTETDYCGTEGAEEGHLREYYCVGATFKSKLYNCEPGKVCDGGMCVEETAEPVNSS